MKLLGTALALSMLCLAASGCGTTKRVVEALPTPPERLICERAGTRPTLPPEYVIAWDVVAAARTVPDAVKRAQSEQAKFVAVIRTREGVVAGYILNLEGVNFICANNAQWRRDFEAGITHP